MSEIYLENIGKCTIINIGKFMLHSNIISLHFITMYSHEDGFYNAWNLEFNVVVSKNTAQEAVAALGEALVSCVYKKSSSPKDFATLKRCMANNECRFLWRHFNRFNQTLLQKGINLHEYTGQSAYTKNQHSYKMIISDSIEKKQTLHTQIKGGVKC
ncbi:MAG: hypothetical protein ATN35_01575 [Epulopiscium sp. Nele67-Bin004]|nr:MAG: hypothetical protein ATN35_01575 [Epulopiscium sp. Nele67-Bin004]